MSKLTRHDLKTKTPAQLAGLFNQTTQGLKGLSVPSQARDEALAALSMIRAEMSCRTPSP